MYTKPKLKIIGTDGNTFSLLGKACQVAIENNMNWDKIQTEATSGNYDDLICTLNKYFDIE